MTTAFFDGTPAYENEKYSVGIEENIIAVSYDDPDGNAIYTWRHK